MAAIKETLKLEDMFSNTLRSYIDLMSKGKATTDQERIALQELQNVSNAYKAVSSASTAEHKQSTAAKEQETEEINQQAAAQRLLAAETDAATAAIRKQNEELKQHKLKQDEAEKGTSSLARGLKNLASAYTVYKAAELAVNTSDNLSRTNARLSMVTDQFNAKTGSQESVESMQSKIMQSANSSRSDYMDTAGMVAKLGTLAGNSFANTDELITFADVINKQMKISGTSSAEASGAMVQLTQAMSSGRLQGDELRSIMEQAPMVAQTIAKYMGVSTGEMKNLASEGKVTAEVVKNAMLDAAKETDIQFKQIPATWSEVGTLMKNSAITTLEPMFDIISSGAMAVADNLETLVPLVYGAAAAFAVYELSLNATKIATKLAKVETNLLNMALSKNPIGAIATLITAVAVPAFISWADSIGGVSNAFKIMGNEAQIALLKADMALPSLTEYVANNKQSINGLVADELAGVGANARRAYGFDETEKVIAEEREKKNALREYQEKQIREAEAENEKLKQGAQENKNAPYSSPDYGDYSSIADGVGNISKDVSDIKKAVDSTEEDLKMLVDMATQRFINKINLTTQAPVITVQGQNTGNTQADARALADALRDMIFTDAASSAGTMTAFVM